MADHCAYLVKLVGVEHVGINNQATTWPIQNYGIISGGVGVTVADALDLSHIAGSDSRYRRGQ
jgi:hypothetical protein